ncbi:phage tail tape measure protein [Erwinia persicina]|uniref:phage tail tape measure protein n=1 Tax=Erwinia persicina TaxID=55211 RepID=UPI00178251FC|nr:phage tail tape measure protein [Erwinia persicina]MBD8169521.1 phage tail tape measure protein [Erwinia persicina]
MTDRNLSIRVAFSAINNLSRPVSAAQKSAASLASQIKATQTSLKGMERNAASFDRLSKASETTARQLAEARKKSEELRASFGPAKQRTDAQTAALKSQSDAVRQLSRAHNEEQAKLSSLRSSLLQHGVLLKGGSTATEQITRRSEAYNRQLSEQQRRLTAVTRAQQQYQHAKETREKLEGGGMRMIATGAAIAAPVAALVTSYAGFENSMKGVAKQVNSLRDENGNRTAQFYEMQKAIKDASERLPMENGANDYAALVEGGARMGATNDDDPWEKQKADLLAFANTAAMASTAFELPASELSESLGKIAGLYSIPTQEIEKLGDVLNYLDDNAKSKGSDIIDVLQRIGGDADKLDYRKAAALASTFLTLGAAPEIAASSTHAMVRELSIATQQSKNFMQGLDAIGLSAEKIQKRMPVDAMGTILTVLEQVKKLPASDQSSVLTQIFGKEFGGSAQKLMNNLPELYRQLKLVNGEAAKGSMKRESDINLDSVDAKWMITKSALQNSFSSLGETLRGPVMEVMGFATKMIQRFRAWAEANPALVATLLKVAAAVGVAIAVLGALALAVASILLPMAAVRLSLSLLTGGRGFAGLLPSVGVMVTKLKNLGPLLSGTGRSVKDWLPIFRSAGAAASNLGSSILSTGRNGISLVSRMGSATGSALTTLFTSPRTALAALGNGLRSLATGGFGTLLSVGRTVLTVLGGGLSVLLSPIGLLVAALAGAALMIWRYWEPIKSFFSGFWSGLISAIAPVKQAFAPLAPIFDGIGNAISRVWNWFKQLFEPVNASAETLRECTEAGRAFGEIVGKAISGVVGVILKVAEGIGWLLKKLGAIPEAANAAKEVAGTMDAVAPQAKKPVVYVWDSKQKKMIAQEWKPAAPAIKAAGDQAPKPASTAPAPAVPPPVIAPAPLAELSGTNLSKKERKTKNDPAPGSAVQETPATVEKLGEIVFKKHPPVMPVFGTYAEPRLAAAHNQAQSLTSRLGNAISGFASNAVSWPSRPNLPGVPVPVTTAGRSNPSESVATLDSLNLTINFYGAERHDAKEIVAMARDEFKKLLREQESRKRSQLRDRE